MKMKTIKLKSIHHESKFATYTNTKELLEEILNQDTENNLKEVKEDV